MGAQALEALKESITYWEDIVHKDAPIMGVAGCALCKEFYYDRCNGCPVKEKTGFMGCVNTPYFKALYGGSREKQKELDFLISLLPEED